DEIPPGSRFTEGAVVSVLVSRYERNPEARSACITHWGSDCYVCGFSFEDKYGPMGKGYIHVHHLVELSAIGHEYDVDPVNDMRPLCANCHAMAHQSRPAMTLDQLRAKVSPTGSAGGR